MQTIYLDISNKGVVPTVYAKQGDVGRKFEVVLTDSGLPYVPTDGSAFSVWYSGASGEGNYTDIGDKSAFSVNVNKVIVEMIAQMLSNAGEGVLSLVLNDITGSQIGLWNIRYVCESVPGAESEKAKEYYTAFSEAVKELSDTKAILKSKLSVDGSNAMEDDLPMGGHKVTGLGTPAADEDAVPLGYANDNYTLKLLWENASPLSDFPAQQVGVDLTGYNAVLVLFAHSTTEHDMISAFAPIAIQGSASRAGFIGYNDAYYIATYRTFVAAGGYVEFGSGMASQNNADATQQDWAMIPRSVYGIKGVR